MNIVFDAIIINFSFILAYYLRFKVLVFITPGSVPVFQQYSGTLIFISILWLAIFKLSGLYDKKTSSLIDETALLFSSVSISSLLLLGMLFLYRGFWFSRLVILNAWGVAFLLLFLSRLLAVITKKILLLKGVGTKKILIIGAGEIGQTIALRFITDKMLGGKPIAFLDDDHAKIGQSYHGILVISGTDKLKEAIKSYGIDEVIFAASGMPYKKILDLITDCETTGIRFKIVPGILEIIASRIDVDEISGVPLITISEIGLAGLKAFIKRTVDIIASFILLIIFSPLFIIVAILIKLDSRGPVLFYQKRVGKNGAIFPMYKFRSMVINAEDIFHDIKDRSEVEGHIFKIKEDPRMTWVGKWIRRLSIDELPQLFNVFLGHMSLVGPRPPIPHEVKNYSPWHKKRLRVAPGITGLWQVSGRSLLPFEDMVRLDIYYIENWSLWLDIKILFQTISVVITANGAY